MYQPYQYWSENKPLKARMIHNVKIHITGPKHRRYLNIYLSADEELGAAVLRQLPLDVTATFCSSRL